MEVPPVPVLTFTPTSPAQQCGALPEEWKERINSKLEDLLRTYKAMENHIDRLDRLDKLLSKLISMTESKYLGASEALQAPANTMTELDNMAKDPNLIQKLKPYIGSNSKMTVRRLLKRCMTRDLALHFSFTGFGEKRTVTKPAFGNHLLCTRILGDAAALQMNDTRQVLISHIQAALRGARDWDGGRKLRLDAAANLSGVGSSPLSATVSTAGVISCTSLAGSTDAPRSPDSSPYGVFISDIEGADDAAETLAKVELPSPSASERYQNKCSSIGDGNVLNDSSES
ncbi:uncharacterized protein LOC108671378 [Hyalella azteca]|uniref:Uncharacterized protein LOC108671378 n=1 Tax=Hyalella azteca TaxID=294128 RepID=A0A8B7NL67_HYAAZ|nr:uncharacterized protein LOC108671378 [Hyalella azteca]XP_047740629.1 uncharacterized protein LOC108671378 [Hyalella azteca]